MSEASTRRGKTLHLGILHGFSAKYESPKYKVQREAKQHSTSAKMLLCGRNPNHLSSQGEQCRPVAACCSREVFQTLLTLILKGHGSDSHLRGQQRHPGLSEHSSPGTPRSGWAVGVSAGRRSAGCGVGSATVTTLQKVSPGTAHCSGHLQLHGGRKGNIREKLLQNICLLRQHPSVPGFAKEPWRTALSDTSLGGGSWREFQPQSKAQGHNCTAMNLAQNKRHSDTVSQALENHFQASSHHFLINNKEYFSFHLKTKLHHLNAVSPQNTEFLWSSGCSLVLIQEACKQTQDFLKQM